MSRLVSFLMLLSLMVMVGAELECKDGMHIVNDRCVYPKREVLDAPMTHRTKRHHGKYIVKTPTPKGKPKQHTNKKIKCGGW